MEVGDILLDSSLENQYTGAIVTFNQLPLVRSRKCVNKIKKSPPINKHVDENGFSQADKNLVTINNSINGQHKQSEQLIN